MKPILGSTSMHSELLPKASTASLRAGCLIITHYQRLLDHVQPHFVHVMIDGTIVESGGPELALKLEEQGYEWLESTAEV